MKEYTYYSLSIELDPNGHGEYIEVIGASGWRAQASGLKDYEVPFGTTVTLRPIETARRKFLQWEDGSKQKERSLTLRNDQEIKALRKQVSPAGIGTVATNSVIRSRQGQLY